MLAPQKCLSMCVLPVANLLHNNDDFARHFLVLGFKVHVLCSISKRSLIPLHQIAFG